MNDKVKIGDILYIRDEGLLGHLSKVYPIIKHTKENVFIEVTEVSNSFLFGDLYHINGELINDGLYFAKEHLSCNEDKEIERQLVMHNILVGLNKLEKRIRKNK